MLIYIEGKSKHAGFWCLVGMWNQKKITTEQFASAPHSPEAVKKRMKERDDYQQFITHVKVCGSQTLENIKEN